MTDKIDPKNVENLHTKDPWSKEEIAYLREYYPLRDHSASKIGAFLGRSRSAVIGKAGRLGLSQDKDRTSVKSPTIRKFD